MNNFYAIRMICLRETFDKRLVYTACLNRRETESYCCAAFVLQLFMVKHDILYIPDNFLSAP